MYRRCMAPFYTLLLATLAATPLRAQTPPHSFTILDYWQDKCETGDETACRRLRANQQAQQKLEKLNTLADRFRDGIDADEFMLDNKPDLGKAYPLVIKNYLVAFDVQGGEAVDTHAIDYCARHFHDYWLNRKFWWPTDAEDKPDWGTIYVYIVDHYHGICLSRPF